MGKNKQVENLTPLLEGYTGPGKLPKDLSKIKIPNSLQKSVKFRYELIVSGKTRRTKSIDSMAVKEK